MKLRARPERHNGVRSNTPWRIAALMALSAIGACGADLVFTGNLQLVAQDSLTVRLADGSLVDARFPKNGDFNAAQIVAEYKLADQVQIRCKESLELKQLRYVAPPTPAEREQVVAASRWREGENLLPHPEPVKAAHDPEGEGLAAFERARKVNLERAHSLPSFIADENVKRYLARKGDAPRLQDTIDAEVAFKSGQPRRENIRVNGKRAKEIPGMQWSVDFGTELKPLFRPECPNTFRFEGRQDINGRSVLAYEVASPVGSCFGYAFDGRRRYIPARTSRILIDEATGYLVRYEELAASFPRDMAVAKVQQSTRWDDVQIGETTHLLPAGYELTVEFTNGVQMHLVGEFRHHRQFQASTAITFEP